MKFLLLLIILALAVSCSVNESQEIESSIRPVANISPPSKDIENIKIKELNEIETVQIISNKTLSDFPKPDKIDEKAFDKQLIRESLEKFALPNLEKQKFYAADFEIRIWRFTDLYMPIYKGVGVSESVFIIKFKDKKWSAKIFRETVKFNNKKEFRKIIQNNFSEPEISWEEFEQQLKNICDVSGEKKKSVPDGEFIIMESKNDENYHIRALRDIEKQVKLFDLIANNFDVEEMKRTKDISSAK